MKKGKKFFALGAIGFLIVFLGVILVISAKMNRPLDNVSLNLNGHESDLFAIMVEEVGDDGVSHYVESPNTSWPSDGYSFNNELSNCIDDNGEILEGILTFNQDTNIASVKTNKATYCYLYFDLESGITVNDLKTKVGTGGLLAKPASVDSWGDLEYRYVGKTADNYICINGDKCNSSTTLNQNETSPYLYRIIGITTDGQLKIIKATQLDETKSWHNTSRNDIKWESSDVYLYLTSSSVLGNIKYIPDNIKSKIINKSWNIGDAKTFTSGKDVITAEQLEKTSNNSQIGLMYISDWYFAYNDGTGTLDCGRKTPYCISWLTDATNITNYKSKNEWSMIRYGISGDIEYGYYLSYDGATVSAYVSDTAAVRPVLYLVSTIRLTSGTGKPEDPFVIK